MEDTIPEGREKQRHAVNRSRQKQRRLDGEAREELERLRQEYKELCRVHGILSLVVFQKDDYPTEIKRKIHEQRPHKRGKASSDILRLEREREVNRSSSWRRDQRLKHDRKQRLREISFWNDQITSIRTIPSYNQ